MRTLCYVPIPESCAVWEQHGFGLTHSVGSATQQQACSGTG